MNWSPLLAGFALMACAGAMAQLAPERTRWVRRLLGLGACLLASLSGATIDAIKLPLTTRFIGLGVFSIPVTMLWLASMTWTLSNTSKLRLLPLSIGAINGATFLAITIAAPQKLSDAAAILCGSVIAICGVLLLICALGVRLKVNAMGSSLIGLALAVATVCGALKNTAFLVLIVPFLLLAVPVLELTYRRRHASLYDLLRDRIGERKAVVILTLLNTYLCFIALMLVGVVTLHFLLKVALLILGALIALVAFTGTVRLLIVRPRFGESVVLFDVPIACITMDEILNRIDQFVQSGTPHMIVTSDTSALMRAQDDDELRQIMCNADLVTPDGFGLVIGARLLGLPMYERVSGVDLMRRLCERAAGRGWRIFLFGARPGVADAAAHQLGEQFPGLIIAGTHHGHFARDDEPAIVERIRTAAPDLLLVALGIPKQEKWIARQIQGLGVGVCIGVGGSFDVHAGNVMRAPLWAQRLGVEWLHRLIREPHRITRALAIPKLLFLVARHTLRQLDQAWRKQ